MRNLLGTVHCSVIPIILRPRLAGKRDSVMVGGIAREMRMIPALVDIARDVKALCPAAWFFNYANPMTANCWATRKAMGLSVVGLCHGTFHVERQLAKFIGAPPQEVSSLCVRLNHLTFIYFVQTVE